MNDGKSETNAVETNKPFFTTEDVLKRLKYWGESEKSFKAIDDVRVESCTINIIFQYSGKIFVIKVNKSKDDSFKKYVLEILNKIRSEKNEKWRSIFVTDFFMHPDSTWRVIQINLRNTKERPVDKNIVTIYNEELEAIVGLAEFADLVESKYEKNFDTEEIPLEESDLEEHELKEHSDKEKKDGKRLKNYLIKIGITWVADDESFDELANEINYIFKDKGVIFMINYGDSAEQTQRRLRRVPLVQVKLNEHLREELVEKYKKHGLDKTDQFYAIYADLRDTRKLPVNPNSNHVFIIYNDDWEGVSKDDFLTTVKEKNDEVRKYMKSERQI